MRKLFLSFTGLLYALKNGTVVPEDLDSALFLFCCTYNHVIHPYKDGCTNEIDWTFGCYSKRGRRAHSVVVKAVRKAKRECRAMFKQQDRPTTFDDLNHLLWMHLIPTIDMGKVKSKRYTPGAAKKAIETQKIGVIAIC